MRVVLCHNFLKFKNVLSSNVFLRLHQQHQRSIRWMLTGKEETLEQTNLVTLASFIDRKSCHQQYLIENIHSEANGTFEVASHFIGFCCHRNFRTIFFLFIITSELSETSSRRSPHIINTHEMIPYRVVKGALRQKVFGWKLFSCLAYGTITGITSFFSIPRNSLF